MGYSKEYRQMFSVKNMIWFDKTCYLRVSLFAEFEYCDPCKLPWKTYANGTLLRELKDNPDKYANGHALVWFSYHHEYSKVTDEVRKEFEIRDEIMEQAKKRIKDILKQNAV